MIGGKKRIGLGIALLLLVALANRLWFIIQLPLTADELNAFQNFIAPGWHTALTDYSSPKNHVLNSLLSTLTLHLPFSETVAIRLTALVASLASALVVFRLVLETQSARFAFFSAGIWMASLSALQFGAVSRGHALVALFALTSYYALRKLLDNAPDPKRWAAVFVVSSALGFLAVPTFLLPFLGMVLAMVVHWLVNRDKQVLILSAFSAVLAIALAVLLYVPIFLNNAVTSLTDNWMIREYDLGNFTFARITDHAQETLTYFDPLMAALFIPMAAISIWLQKGWNGRFMSQALLMFAVSFGYVGFSGTIPPASALVFLTPFVIMAVSEGMYNGYNQVSQRYRKGMMVLIALLPILVLVNSNQAMYRSAKASPIQELPSSTDLPTVPAGSSASPTDPNEHQ